MAGRGRVNETYRINHQLRRSSPRLGNEIGLLIEQRYAKLKKDGVNITLPDGVRRTVD